MGRRDRSYPFESAVPTCSIALLSVRSFSDPSTTDFRRATLILRNPRSAAHSIHFPIRSSSRGSLGTVSYISNAAPSLNLAIRKIGQTTRSRQSLPRSQTACGVVGVHPHSRQPGCAQVLDSLINLCYRYGYRKLRPSADVSALFLCTAVFITTDLRIFELRLDLTYLKSIASAYLFSCDL